MCGIAGFVDAVAPPSAGQTLPRMTDRIARRGPGDTGLFAESSTSIAHRWLGIIVSSELGHQPIANADWNCPAGFGGEIFNHAAIRPAPELAHHRYKSGTDTDTETILGSSEQCGQDCVTHFRGMFVFAIWDWQRQLLFCAGDRLSIKPSYFGYDGNIFAFASEMQALLEHPAIGMRQNEKLASEYPAFGYTSGEDTLFVGIRLYRDMPGPDRIAMKSDTDWICDPRRRIGERVAGSGLRLTTERSCGDRITRNVLEILAGVAKCAG